ncbi:ABC transporter substrate-binding protein [Streptomyces sp. NBC_01476]|uniref:ABC transporter substrate-binding protein n=1 Tax=Streptomyces sp. NBC_01476 TaxID=2903881 RepID=UPI002E2EDE0E|nr:ABC transporter substrate-binding protein [Streptomyces sp. NBC_01476]
MNRATVPSSSTPSLGRRSFLGLGLGAGAALALAACGGSGSGGSGSGTGSSVLKWGWSLPTSWDPVFSSAGWDVHVLSLVYAGLTKLDPHGAAVPALASSWSYNPQGTQVTFKLRPGLTFSDGSALDATAVKKSLERGISDPKSLVSPQLTSVKAVSAPDPATVVIDLTHADYQLPNLLAGKTGMIVNPAAFTTDAAGIAAKPAGAGPFTLTSYTQNAKAVLRRNPGYWDAASIKLTGFELYPLPDASTVVAALQSGQYNVAQIPGSQVDAAKAAGLEVQVIPSMVVATLDVNSAKAPFDKPLVVEALKYAIDREALVKTQEFGHGEAAYQPFPKGYAGYDPNSADLFPYNPAKAKELLAQAGYPNGLDVTLTTSVAEGAPEQIQAQLKQVGINAKIQVIPATQFTQIVYIQHDRQLSVDQFAGRDSAVQAFQVLFGEQGLMNPGRTTPPELTAALDKVTRTPLDSPDYPKALQAATAYAVRNTPNVFLYTVPRILARAKSVSALPETTVVQRFEGVTAG